ncbi:EF-hand domain-containing protein [Paraglaciecola sp. 2405UD69-4]|uniref:EF-hand domain-containing protein n=1 Tax=Paraglaciecola sp. 2405UD69-4 TaxID=3391836 RepID=UPI0039C95006
MFSVKSTFSKLFIASVALALTFSATAQERGNRDMQRPERPSFSSLDLDGDGVVTFAEFEQSEVPNDEHATIFGHIDADGDGEITEEEFTSHKPPRRN